MAQAAASAASALRTLKLPARRRRIGDIAPRCPRREAHRRWLGDDVVGAQVRGDVGQVGVGEPGGHRDGREMRKAEWVTGIEDGDAVGSRRHALEQARLGRQVAVAAAVQLEVLGGDPREHRGAELHAVGAVHLERVRRGLERDVRAAGVADAGELGLQLGRLRGRLPRRVGGQRRRRSAGRRW